MSFPDAFAPDMVLGPDQVLPTVPRGFGERFDLEWKAARAPDKSYFYETRMRDLYDDALDRLRKATGQSYPNPFTLAPALSIPSPARLVVEPLDRILFGDRGKAIDEINKAFDQALAGQHDLPNPRLFEDKIRGEATKLRQDAAKAALAGYGASGLGAFLGAAAGELSHPVNLATLPVGGTYASANIARIGLLRFIGRNALAEAGVAALSQTAIEAMDAPIQERLGTDTGLADRIERIFIAGAGGAILGLGLSGLVAAARGLRKGLTPTLDEADALKVAERATLHEGKNPLGPDGVNAHARALDAAEVQVAAGRHANVDEIVREEVRRQVAQEAPPRAAASPTEAPSIMPPTSSSSAPTSSSIAPDARPTPADEAARLTEPPAPPARQVPAGDPFPAVIDRTILDRFPTPKGADAGKASDVIAATVDAALKSGRTVTRYVDGKPIGIVAVDRGMLQDSKGQRWGNLSIYTSKDASNRIEISPEPPPAQAADATTLTRAIAAAAPPVPEKAAATAKAQVEMSNARAIAETNAEAKAALEASAEEAKMANKVKNCAMGVAI